MNKIRILFFATFRDMVGEKEISIEIPDGMVVKDLKEVLANQYPKMKPALSSLLVAVNKDYAVDETVIPNKAEVAMFPPVSGGSGDYGEASLPTVVKITQDDLDINDMLAKITLTSTGAACIFTGMVRGETTRDHTFETAFLEYEAYNQMAEEKMYQVAQEIREKWPTVEGVAIVQRVGKLFPGTPTVMIACTAGHRDTGVFEAAKYGIDRLKQIVPIWKKEVGPDGESWVHGEYQPTQGE